VRIFNRNEEKNKRLTIEELRTISAESKGSESDVIELCNLIKDRLHSGKFEVDQGWLCIRIRDGEYKNNDIVFRAKQSLQREYTEVDVSAGGSYWVVKIKP